MRDLFIKFRKSEDGASLVEYAVALIVVTIVGGAGVVLIGQDSGVLATCGADIVEDAATDALNATSGTQTVSGGAATC